MKNTLLIPLLVAFPCLAGCASTPQLTQLQPVGPAPTAQPGDRTVGGLRVYSARKQTRLDVNTEVFFEGEKFLQDMRSLPAHSDYEIYGADGKLVKQVRNSRNIDDDQPAWVALPAGRYEVQARTEGADGEITTVQVPVVVEAAKATVVHLEGDWRPRGHYTNAEIVRLANGQIAGWRAEPADVLHTVSTPPAH